MPVYQNNTTHRVSTKIEVNAGQQLNIEFQPGERKSMEYILTHADLTLISAEPYYKPIVALSQVVSTGDDQTVPLNFDAHVLSIYNPSEILVTCYIQSKSNTPGVPVYPGTERLIDLNHNCSQIILEFADEATVYVEQRRN